MCHDPNRELFFMTVSREQMSIASSEDNAFRTVIESRADGIPALA